MWQWFEPDEEIDGQTLKKQYFEKKVQADIKLEKNAGRVAGPSDDESFYFIKHIKIIKIIPLYIFNNTSES
ncbi:hypothetical protein [Acinetobacter bereziniae]|uniref:hypothetical protein n=1 Tax=Acinetobacter bereziniae TaxID=106648 RepID=UPI00300B98CD